VIGGGSGVGSSFRMNYAGGAFNNLLAGNGDNFFNCVTGKINAAGGVKFNGGGTTLNYYEEGSFTPTLTIGGSSAGITYTVRIGAYTRVGRLVTIQLGVKMSSIGSNTGEIQITGLPFSVISDSYYHPYGVVGVVLQPALLPLYALGAGSAVVFRKASTVSDVAPTSADIDDDTYIFVTMTYSAA
jgi:hypothetical protein